MATHLKIKESPFCADHSSGHTEEWESLTPTRGATPKRGKTLPGACPARYRTLSEALHMLSLRGPWSVLQRTHRRSLQCSGCAGSWHNPNALAVPEPPRCIDQLLPSVPSQDMQNRPAEGSHPSEAVCWDDANGHLTSRTQRDRLCCRQLRKTRGGATLGRTAVRRHHARESMR